MRKHAGLIGLALLLVAVAASGCGSTAPRAQANDTVINNVATHLAVHAPVATAPAAAPAVHTSADGASLIRASLNSEDRGVSLPAGNGMVAAPAPLAAATQTPLPTATAVPTATPAPTATTPPTAAPTATTAPTATPTTAPTATEAPTATAVPTQAPTQAPAAPAATGPLTPDRLVIPSIHLDSKIVTVGWHPEKQADGSTELVWDVAQYAVGWHKTSTHPGEVGNMVLAGHSDIYGKVFEHLGDVQLGQQITVWAAGHAFNYTVDQKFVVPETNVSFEQRLQNGTWIGPFPDERLTLFTCWPPNNNTHRIFVIAHPTKNQ
jgi:sortase A